MRYLKYHCSYSNVTIVRILNRGGPEIAELDIDYQSTYSPKEPDKPFQSATEKAQECNGRCKKAGNF